MIPGETIASGAIAQCECGHMFENEVLQSAAGYYIGTTCHGRKCDEAGIPYSRESGYYRTRADAERALKRGGFER